MDRARSIWIGVWQRVLIRIESWRDEWQFQAARTQIKPAPKLCIRPIVK